MKTLRREMLACAGIAILAGMLTAPAFAQEAATDSTATPTDTTRINVPHDGRPGPTTISVPGVDALAQVVGLEEKRRKAMVAADVKTLEAIIAEDATYVHATGIMQKRDELLRLLANKTIQYISFDLEKTSYSVYGATVVGTGVQKIAVMSGGKPLTIHSRYTVVYTLRERSEQLIAYQSTPLPEMTPAKK